MNSGTDCSKEHVERTATSLIERLKLEDAQAWQQLVTLYGPLVYSWTRRAGVPPEDSRDVVQDVFQSVVRYVASFRRDQPGDSFRGWLYTITKSKVAEHWRRQRGPQAAGGTEAMQRMAQFAEEDSRSVSGVGDAIDSDGTLIRAMELIRAEFENQTWRAVWSVVVEGRSPADVATELGMSTNAVYVAKSRILRRLREELADLID